MLRLLCIANPLAYKGTATDAPLSYAALAAHPEIDLFHADTDDMMDPGDRILASPIASGFVPHGFDDLGRLERSVFDPEAFDLVFCRTLKPFPPGYLDRLVERSGRLLFVNDPAGIRQQLSPSFFQDAVAGKSPDMLITSGSREACEFMEIHGTIVVKRANSCGGVGVYRVAPNDDGGVVIDNIVHGSAVVPDFRAWFRGLVEDSADDAILMRYLPRVLEGDRRIVVIGGEIFGSYLRVSDAGQWVQNVSAGANCSLSAVTPEDEDVVRSTFGHYARAGINFLGYDLIRDDDGTWRVSEINAGNIGGIFRLEQMGIPGTTDRFVAWLHRFAGKGKHETRG